MQEIDRGVLLIPLLAVLAPLPIIVAVTSLGVDAQIIGSGLAAALVGAGMLSVLLFPLIGMAVRGELERGATERADEQA